MATLTNFDYALTRLGEIDIFFLLTASSFDGNLHVMLRHTYKQVATFFAQYTRRK